MSSASGPVWRALAASCRGASHEVAGTANQDAFATLSVGEVTAAAVADGHGHRDHFRSAQGARLAADLAVNFMTAAARSVDDPRALHQALKEQVGPDVVRDWRQRVLDHASSTPFSEAATERLIGSGDEAVLRAYGTTLIALVGTSTAVGFAQIGDGDAIAVFGDGDVVRPLPEDPKLDGVYTTSLSQRNACESLRVAALDLGEREVKVAFAVTDGFAAPQIDGLGWWRQVGQQLGTHLHRHGSAWISDKLPDWLTEPARTGGDDTTIALLLNESDALSNG